MPARPATLLLEDIHPLQKHREERGEHNVVSGCGRTHVIELFFGLIRRESLTRRGFVYSMCRWVDI